MSGRISGLSIFFLRAYLSCGKNEDVVGKPLKIQIRWCINSEYWTTISSAIGGGLFSLSALISHSWELIEMNGCRGLKCLDESWLEANNKVLWSISTKLARKTCQSDNLEDVINRLWLGSDPKVNNIRLQSQAYCKVCNEYGYSAHYCKIAHPIFGPLSSDDVLLKKLCCWIVEIRTSMVFNITKASLVHECK